MPRDPDLHHGFKRLTVANWQSADLPRMFPLMTPEVWVNTVLRFQLNGKVSGEIRAMFEVARGSVLYGWFFYPLLTLASEQCFRVSEAAASDRCCMDALLPRKLKKSGDQAHLSFGDYTRALAGAQILTGDDVRRWELARKLRNTVSHPKFQRIHDPAGVLRILKTTSGLIHKIYS